MDYRRLGRSGMQVSELALGTMTFGRELDRAGSTELFHAFLDAGGTFVDTADVYGRGASEEIVGEAIRSSGVERDGLVVATKVYGPMSDAADSGQADRNNLGLSRKHIVAACDASLRRLGLDHIDLYQVHVPDDATDLEETMVALDDLVRAGKVRYLGCSNYPAWQTVAAVGVSERLGLHRLVAAQPQYSLVERHIEAEIVPACRQSGIGILPWSPLGGGFLSGKYTPDRPPPAGSRVAEAPDGADEAWTRRATDRNWAILTVLGEIAAETGRSYAQIALNWLLRQPGVTAPVVGARTLDQLTDNLGAAGWRLDDDQVRRLDDVSRLPEVYPYRILSELRVAHGRTAV